jgi:hypothetical protein
MKRNHRGYRVGEGHHRARLDDATVRRMRDRRQRNGWSYRRIADEVGCSLWTARDIVTGATRPL